MKGFFVCVLLLCLFFLYSSHTVVAAGGYSAGQLFAKKSVATTLPGDESNAINTFKTLFTLTLLIVFHSTAVHYLVYLLILMVSSALQLNPTSSENLIVFNSWLLILLLVDPIYLMRVFAKAMGLGASVFWKSHKWWFLIISVATFASICLYHSYIGGSVVYFIRFINGHVPILAWGFSFLNRYSNALCGAYLIITLAYHFIVYLVSSKRAKKPPVEQVDK